MNVTRYEVIVHEPEATITSTMIRWAIIQKIQMEHPGAQIRHVGFPNDSEFKVEVDFKDFKETST